MSAMAFLRRLTASRSGVAATEFALSLPLLLTAGLYGVETANQAVMQMRVSQIAVLIADNASRASSSLNGLMIAVMSFMKVPLFVAKTVLPHPAAGLHVGVGRQPPIRAARKSNSRATWPASAWKGGLDDLARSRPNGQ